MTRIIVTLLSSTPSFIWRVFLLLVVFPLFFIYFMIRVLTGMLTNNWLLAECPFLCSLSFTFIYCLSKNCLSWCSTDKLLVFAFGSRRRGIM